MEVMKFTARFCQEHGLRFYSCGGTMLGAVRHGGFIPWDDDIDLYMPRADYQRLLELRPQLSGTGYDCVAVESEQGYYCPWAKIVDLNTTIWEYSYYRHPIGVYVDIFTLDYYHLPKEQILKKQHDYSALFISYLKSLKSYSMADYLTMLRKGQFHAALKNICFQLFYRPCTDKHYQHVLQATDYYGTAEDAEICVCLTSSMGKVFRTEWFRDCEDMPFEDITLPVPRKYDDYLTLVYGDWRKLPPAEKRVSVHEFIYLDLNRRLSLQEMEELLTSK